jgi:hypothetical protein
MNVVSLERRDGTISVLRFEACSAHQLPQCVHQRGSNRSSCRTLTDMREMI